MKTRGKLTLAILLASGLAFQAHAQSVTLGDATFDATSDEAPVDGFGALALEKVGICEGYGDNAGIVKTLQYNIGAPTADGVNCISCTSIDGATTEELLLAFDTAGNLRVLKASSGDVVSFEASATTTAPVLMPVTQAAGQSWEALGKTHTVVATDASRGGEDNLLQVKVETTGAAVGSPFETHYYKAGSGLIAVESSSSAAEGGSGWNISTP